MFTALKQMFMTITVFFSAAEKGAKALDHLAGWAEQSAGAFADKATIERADELAAMQAASALKAKAIANASKSSAKAEDKVVTTTA